MGRDMLIRTHMQDLKDVTNNVHYENFRTNKLSSVTSSDGSKSTPTKSPLAQMEDEKVEHMQKMKKMESEYAALEEKQRNFELQRNEFDAQKARLQEDKNAQKSTDKKKKSKTLF